MPYKALHTRNYFLLSFHLLIEKTWLLIDPALWGLVRRKNSGNSGTEYHVSCVVSSAVYCCYDSDQRSGVMDESSAEKKVGLEE